MMQTNFFSSLVVLLAFGKIAASVPALTDSPASVLKTLGVSPSLAQGVAAGFSSGDASLTCKILGFLFPRNETFASTSSYYTDLYEVPWSETCWLKPACIVTPISSQEVSTIMKVLTALKTKFAIRSGGHISIPGFSSVGSDGVLVALQNLKELTISSDRSIVTVGTGNHWGDVYNHISEFNVTVVGGRVPIVGVGGFLLGGGLSLFYDSWGLGMDNVSRYRVVLTNGTILEASPKEHTDLYHALKGGLTNLGIVTEFDLMTKKDGDVHYEVYSYKSEDTPAVIKAYGEFLTSNKDFNSSIQIQIEQASSTVFLGSLTPADQPAIFDKFRSIPSLSTEIPPTNGSILPVLNFGGLLTTFGSWYTASFSHKVIDPNIMLESYDLYVNLSVNLPADMKFEYVPQGIRAGLVQAGRALNGGNLLGLSETPQAWVNVYMSYSHLNQTAEAARIVNEFASTVGRKAEDEGLSLPYVYPNDAGADQKPLLGYGQENLQTIKTVAAKYDPKGYMQTLQNDGYLISNE